MERPTRIYFIRHGQTTINEQGKLSGFTNPPLTDLGKAQAAAAARLLEGKRFDRIFSSPLDRAADTARYLADASDSPVELVEGLKEQNFGEWEGKSFTEIFDLIPGGAKNLLRGPFLARFPAGEGTEAFVARVMKTYRDEILAGNEQKKVAVVTHSGVIVVLLCHFLGIDPFSNFFRIRIDNGSVTMAERFEFGLYHLRYINRVGHLDG